MITCVNKNDRNFKSLEKKYGTSLADMFTRVYSREKKLLSGNEFYIPTEKEFFEWYKLNKANKYRLVNYIISENPKIPRSTVKQLLKGVIHTFNGEIFITSGWTNTGSLIINQEQLKTIFEPNLKIMMKLAELHPDVFEIKDTNKSYVKRVILKSPEGAGEDLFRTRPDSKIKSKYFISNDVQRVQTVLTRLRKSTHPLNEVAKKLLEFTGINNVEIELVDVPYFENVSPEIKKANGYYSSTENRIYIAKGAGVTDGLSESLILHEIIHAFTYYALREDTKIAKDFKKLYEHAVEKLGKYDPVKNTGYYPTYDFDEFMVGLFTNSKFIRELQKIPPVDGIKYTNLFEEIMNYILDLLKINNNPTLYEQAFSVASDIIQTEQYRVDMMDDSYSGEELMEQKTSGALPSQASQKTLNIIKDFLKKIGVDINVMSEITVNGVTYNANAIAQISQKLISVVEGKEAQALPEEAMHFAVEIVKQTNPKLYQKLLKEINDYQILKDVFAEYGNDPLYQINKKPNVIKLKEEAIGKLLVEKIIAKVEGINDSPENLQKVQSWWKEILDWMKSLIYQKSGFDQMTIDIISGKIENPSMQLSDEIFLQKNQQDLIFDTLKDLSNRIDKRTNSKGEERYFIDNKEIPFRVSDFAGNLYKSQMQNRDLTKTEFEEALDDLRKEKGTAGHADLEHAFTLFVDENGYLRDPQIREYNKKNDLYASKLGNQAYYELLRDHIEQRLQYIDNQSEEGARFLSEVKIYNGRKTGGTIDLMAVTKDGKVKIFDWKFMNLNTGTYEDIPWYKVEAWNTQINEYKKILMMNYGVKSKDFEETRMVPILAQYSTGKRGKGGTVVELPKLTGIKIGDVNVENISDEEDYLLPVATKDEISDNKELDSIISKLNIAYERFRKEKVSPDKKDDKKEQLQSLFKAIRRLQIKKDVRPLIEQAELLKKKTDEIFEKYSSVYKNPTDISKFTDAELNDFSKEIEDSEKTLETYVNVHLLLKSIADNDIKNSLRDISDYASEALLELKNINNEFVDQILAKRDKINDILSPEKIIKGLTKWFASTSTLQVKSIQLLFKQVNRAFAKADIDTQEESRKLLTIRDKFMDWANKKGLSRLQLFSLIKKKDKNELIDQYNPEFYKLLKEAIKEKNYDWIRNNVNESKLNEALEKKLEEEIQRIKNKPRTVEDEIKEKIVQSEINKAKNLYTISTATSNGWLLYNLVRNSPKESWETQQWKDLNKSENAPVKEFYDYITQKNEEYADLGYISKQEARIFLPFIKGSLIEAAITGQTNKLSLGQRFWESISVDGGDSQYGQIDPETGRVINTVPKYFTNEFDGILSEDLFKTMSIYNEAALRYKYVSEIEYQARAIARVERNKRSIMTSSLGKVIRDKRTDSIQYEPEGTVGNYDLYDSMMKAIVYGQKYVDSDNFDAALFKLGEWGKTLNEKLGMKVFPEDLSGRQITVNKAVDTLNSTFSFVTLGINLGSSISNLFGGSMQSIINSGKYFTKTDFVKAEMQIFANKFNGEDKNKFIKALEYFLPLTDNYNREMTKKLSVDIVSEEGFQDFIMGLMKNSDRAVQTANFYAYLSNSAVIDGKVVNVREYLRTLPDFQGRFSGTVNDKEAFDRRFDAEVTRIMDESGVMKIGSVQNGKFVIPGVENKDESVIELRRIVQGLTKSALGNLSSDDIRMINTNILGKSFMVFKNWIPRLVDVRMGSLKYNAATDAYEWGRMRTVFSVLQENLISNLDGIVGLVLGNDKGMELMRNAYEKKAEEYELETGRKLELTEDLFIELMHSNLKAAAVDAIFLAGLMSLLLLMHTIKPDDDEDPIVKNQFNFVRRLLDKVTDELLYFYNPASVLQLIGGGPFPAVSLIINGTKAIKNFGMEMFAIGIGDEELEESNKVIKYVMRTFPIANQSVGYIPLFYPDIAKDLGIRVQSNYGIR